MPARAQGRASETVTARTGSSVIWRSCSSYQATRVAKVQAVRDMAWAPATAVDGRMVDLAMSRPTPTSATHSVRLVSRAAMSWLVPSTTPRVSRLTMRWARSISGSGPSGRRTTSRKPSSLTRPSSTPGGAMRRSRVAHRNRPWL
jgi:hypothetical protein